MFLFIGLVLAVLVCWFVAVNIFALAIEAHYQSKQREINEILKPIEVDIIC